MVKFDQGLQQQQALKRAGWFIYGCFILLLAHSTKGQGLEGYYQSPCLHKTTIIFCSEGDLWKVSTAGGMAQRLTAHSGEEQHPAISPDGKTIAFTAAYDGSPEVYTMPIEGGVPLRCTFSNTGGTRAVGWTPQGKLIYSSTNWSNLPNARLATIDLQTKSHGVLPLFEANDGIQNEEGTWFFVPLSNFNGHVKRYKGGWSRHIWRFDGKNEAVKLTHDHLGESYNPMWHQNRLFFITDRDGMKNIWSMDANGKNLQQHTFHSQFDVRMAKLDMDKIVYQHGADLWLLNLADGKYQRIDIRLTSDFDQLRERWVNKPEAFISSVNLSPKGDKLVVTSRGRVFVVPVKAGRTLALTDSNEPVVRHRDAVFSADGSHIISLSDGSGEFEFTQYPANGKGSAKQLSQHGKPLRYEGIPSSDGKWLAYDDNDKHLYILNVATGNRKKISTNEQGIRDFAWSPDSQWLAFVQVSLSGFTQIKIYNAYDGSLFDLTNDRSNNSQVKWGREGQFIYFISDRSLGTMTGNARDARLGGVGWEKPHKVYHVALMKGLRSPFRPVDELHLLEATDTKVVKPVVNIDKDDIQARTMVVPIESGNYYQLEVGERALYLLSEQTGKDPKTEVKAVTFARETPVLTTLASGIEQFKMSSNGQKLLVKKGGAYFLTEAGTGSLQLTEAIDLGACTFSLNPKSEWQQLYKDAWRMERDCFYDTNMHGLDWDAMYTKYLPLVHRVSSRSELNEVLAELTGELSVLHTFVFGGDLRSNSLSVPVGSLGANTSRDVKRGGFRIDHIYQSDPDFPERQSPLSDPYLDIKVGDIITMVNGKDALTVTDIGELLLNQAGKQVRLAVKRGNASKEIIITVWGDAYWLKYRDWQYTNRLKVEAASNQQIGYLHMSANSDWDIGHFYREYFPVANKQGFIIDMRNNQGGYISSLLLQMLHRQVWMYRVDRTGEPIERIPHMVVLVNERTGSDGEVFAEGFRRLGLGSTLGMRTWGGFIALHYGNKLSDNGVVSAPMHAAYSNEGIWLVEGHGHVPDMVVENLPWESFQGKDAQLEAAVAFLQQQIALKPNVIPLPPPYPDKSFPNNRKP